MQMEKEMNDLIQSGWKNPQLTYMMQILQWRCIAGDFRQGFFRQGWPPP